MWNVWMAGLWARGCGLNIQPWTLFERDGHTHAHTHTCSTQGRSPGIPNSTLQSHSCQPSASLSKICTTARHESWRNERLLSGALLNKSSISEISREHAGGFSLADSSSLLLYFLLLASMCIFTLDVRLLCICISPQGHPTPWRCPCTEYSRNKTYCWISVSGQFSALCLDGQQMMACFFF